MPTVALLALHGFAGTGADFEPAKQATGSAKLKWFAPDLPGHGSNRLSTADLGRLSFTLTDAFVERAFAGLAGNERWILGYSMGGRVALHAVASGVVQPDRLILIGASPGLLSADERASRSELEESWAVKLEQEGMARFAEFWESLPIIRSQESIPEPTRSLMRERRANQDPSNMAAVLRQLGTGRMPPLWSSLAHIACPTDLLAGAFDEKFRVIAARMLPCLKKAQYHGIPAAGHTAHLENPDYFAEIILSRLPKSGH